MRAITTFVTATATLASLSNAVAVPEDNHSAAANGAPSAGDESRVEAKRRFEEGQILYSLGEYESAIDLFRRAYELSGASALLFNIAQAHRLNGNCRQAMEIYRHFVRLTPESPERHEAESHIAVLAATCPVVVPTPAATTKAERPRWHREWPTRARSAGGLLGAGIVLGVSAGILYAWNDGQYHRWTAQDRALAAPPPLGTSPAARIAAQNANDNLIQSIRRVDIVVWAAAVLSGVAVAGAAVVGILPERRLAIQGGPGVLGLTWQATWR